MRLDISSTGVDSSVSSRKSRDAVLDTAVRVKFGANSSKRLLVATNTNKLLEFSVRSGAVETQVPRHVIHSRHLLLRLLCVICCRLRCSD